MRLLPTLAAALALTGAFASTASATPIDDVLLDNGAELSFGNSWNGGAATLGGDFDWNLSGGLTTGRLTNGNLYIENSTAHARVQIEYYKDSAHTDGVVATRDGGEKIGTGAFLNTFPITVGGVNCDCTHSHLNLQKLINGQWKTVDTELEYL
jgi:hypothetical protein